MYRTNFNYYKTHDRYLYQGQEMDDEVKGDGNSVNFTFRMYDPRLGRFFAIDPLVNEYPSLTTYQFCSNSPIYMVEIEGKEGTMYIYKVWLDKKGYHQQYCGSFKVEGLKSDIVKTVLMPFGNPQGAPVQLKYTLRFKNGERGSSVTYSYADKPTVKQLNDFFGDNMPKKEEPKEKTFTQKLNEAAPSWAKHGAMESGDDGANTGGNYSGSNGMYNAADDVDFIGDKLSYIPTPFTKTVGAFLQSEADVLRTIADYNTKDSKIATLNLGIRLVSFGVEKKIGKSIDNSNLSKKKKYILEQTTRKTVDAIKNKTTQH
jgi:RHS repeat-associated protein